MSEKPILFSGPMVRAILDGSKTQTRRVMKLQPSINPDVFPPGSGSRGPSHKDCAVANWPGESEFDGYDCHCPYGAVGGRLWVRENIYFHRANQNHYYSADKRGVGHDIHFRLMAETSSGNCKATARTIPSIHMPKWACRLFLEITDIRVERLQDISEEDARAEGVEPVEWHNFELKGNTVMSAQRPFMSLWDSINGKKHPWADNPWLWVVEFKHA